MGTSAVSRYNLEPEPVNSPDAETKLRADAGVRVVLQLCFVMLAEAKAKTVTNNLPLLSVLWAVVSKPYSQS